MNNDLCTDIFIISGFLGTGKTTLIKELIDGLFKDNSIAVIENEFGDIGIDGDFLRETTPIVTEIRSGCICCSLTGEFKKSIRYIIENYDPEVLIIEPSGVAKTSELINSCLELSDITNLKQVINVIDCKNHQLYERNFEGFYKNQILSSNLIFLSKTDSVSMETLDIIKSGLVGLNPEIRLISDIHSINEESVYTDLLSNLDLFPKEDGLHGRFEQFCFMTDIEFDEASICRKMEHISKNKNYGEIFRAKGVLNSEFDYSHKIDMVGSNYKTIKTFYCGIGRICFIGFDLNKVRIKDLFSIGKI